MVSACFMSSFLRPVLLLLCVVLLCLCRSVHAQPFCATASIDLSTLAIDWPFSPGTGFINYTLHPCGVVDDPVCSSASPDTTYCYQAPDDKVGSRCDWNESLASWSESSQEIDLYQLCNTPACDAGVQLPRSVTWRFRCDWWAEPGYIASITEPIRCQYVVTLMTPLVCDGPVPPRPRSSSSSTGGGQQAGDADGLSTAATAGIVVLVLALAAAAAVGAFLWWRRRRASHDGLSELLGSDERVQPLAAAAADGDYAPLAEGEPREGSSRRG